MNILFITSDQQRPDAIGCLNASVQTPHLDRLAKEGILFERAYTVNPVCTPSRCSMLTGHYPSRHGCFHVGTNLPMDYGPTVAHHLSDAGYSTALLGKAHFQACKDPVSFESAPHIHDLDFFRDWAGPYFGFEHAELVIGHTSEPHAGGMNYGAWLVDQGIDLKQHFDIHDYDHYGPWSLSAEYHGSKWVADRSMAAIDRAVDGKQPFFVWASFQDPHNPYVTPEPWASMYRGTDMLGSVVKNGETNGKPPFYEALMTGNFYGDDPDLQDRGWGDCKIRPELTEADVKNVRAVYNGMVSLMDHHIGRLLAHLEKHGLMDETLIVFTSDHGDYLGDHGLWGKGLPTYECMQRVPFIVRHPQCETPGVRSKALQSLVDLEASFLNVAGLSAGSQSQGICQTASWTDANNQARDWALIEFRPSHGRFMQRTYVEGRYKLVRYENRDYGELYDLEADPHQFENLFDAPQLAQVRDEMIKRFDAHGFKEEIVRERMAVA